MKNLKKWIEVSSIGLVLLLGTAQPGFAHAQVVDNSQAIADHTAKIAALVLELQNEVAELQALQGGALLKGVPQVPVSIVVKHPVDINVSPEVQAQIDRIMDTQSDKIGSICQGPNALSQRLNNQILNLLCLQNGIGYPAR